MTRLITPILDLTRYAWRQRHGDLFAYGTWRYDTDDDCWVPCLVIVPAFRRIGHARTTPCIVTLDLAWIWSEEEGDPRFAAEVAIDFCLSLDLAPSPQNAYRIASIIRDHLEDLIKRVPPRPRDRTVVAEAVLTEASGKKHIAEIAD